MDLEKQVKIIDTIRETLEGYMGQELKVRANMGRSKIVESEGTLMQIHPQLFIMELKRKRGRTSRQSYQYVDVLTGTVELLQDGEPIFAPFITETPEESIEVDLEEALQVDTGETEEDTEEEHVVL
ncbi:MAG: Veg family protein [Eggerthellaceae bacterium]|nr:Veg family protein [Eggerthellaceae bacterium]